MSKALVAFLFPFGIFFGAFSFWVFLGTVFRLFAEVLFFRPPKLALTLWAFFGTFSFRVFFRTFSKTFFDFSLFLPPVLFSRPPSFQNFVGGLNFRRAGRKAMQDRWCMQVLVLLPARRRHHVDHTITGVPAPRRTLINLHV